MEKAGLLQPQQTVIECGLLPLAKGMIWGEEALLLKLSLKGLMAGSFLLTPLSKARATNPLVRGDLGSTP